MVPGVEARGTREVAPSGDQCGVKLQFSALFAHPCWSHPKPDVPRSERGDPVEAKILRLRGADEPARHVDATSLLLRSEEGNDLVAYNPLQFVR